MKLEHTVHTALDERPPVFKQAERRGKALDMSVEGPVVSNFQDIMHEAALQGLGILYSYDEDVTEKLIAAVRLKRVLAEWAPAVPGLFLYYSSRHQTTPALRGFIDCLLDRDLVRKRRKA
jgi:DNA-binding transcriptional LysR family regulator